MSTELVFEIDKESRTVEIDIEVLGILLSVVSIYLSRSRLGQESESVIDRLAEKMWNNLLLSGLMQKEAKLRWSEMKK